MLHLLFVFALITRIGATVFEPQPLNQQIRESDGVILGHFLKSKSIELEDGKIATQMFFKVTREHGLQSDLFGMDEIIVHYPGGSIGDRNTRVDGVPEFVVGEKIVLFIRSLDNRYWGMNLGFGSFRVINYGKVTMLVNYIFPQHSRVGQVSLADFEKTLKIIKGSSFKTVENIQYLTREGEEVGERSPASAAPLERQNRSIASDLDQSENGQDHSNVNVMWLVGVLSILGGIFRMYRQRPLK